MKTNKAEKIRQERKKTYKSCGIQSILTNKEPIKSVSSPNAQTNSLCVPGEGDIGSYQWSVCIYEAMSKESIEMAMLFLFQYESGCRLSEAQKITYDQILSNGDIKLLANKKGENRMIQAGRVVKYLLDCRKEKINPFGTFNRFFIHRFYKKYGVIFKSEKSKKNSTTHAMRHLKAKTQRNEGIEKELISKQLGHKNKKNVDYYGKGE